MNSERFLFSQHEHITPFKFWSAPQAEEKQVPIAPPKKSPI